MKKELLRRLLAIALVLTLAIVISNSGGKKESSYAEGQEEGVETDLILPEDVADEATEEITDDLDSNVVEEDTTEIADEEAEDTSEEENSETVDEAGVNQATEQTSDEVEEIAVVEENVYGGQVNTSLCGTVKKTYGGEATIEGNTTSKTTITFKNCVLLTYHDKDTSIGREHDGYWVGFDIVEPSESLLGAGLERKGDNGQVTRYFENIKDGTYDGRRYTGIWLWVTQEFLDTYGDGYIEYEYKFDWDYSDTKPTDKRTYPDLAGITVDQTVIIRIDPKTVTFAEVKGTHAEHNATREVACDATKTSDPHEFYKSCTICGRNSDETFTTDCSYGEWKTTKEATCTEKGTKTRTCTICGNEESADIDPINHKNATYVAAEEATCTKAGNIEYWHCGDCKKDFSDEACTKEIEATVIAAKGHKEGASKTKPAKAATCSEEGYTGDKVCTECGATLETGTVIEKLPHTPAEDKVGAKAPTCTDEGNTGKTVCKDCGATISEGTVIPATGHKYEDGKCSVCDDPDPLAVVTVDKQIDPTAPATDINTSRAELLASVLTPEEIAYVEEGLGDIEVLISVSDLGDGASATVPSEDKALIVGALADGMQVGFYIDLSIFKTDINNQGAYKRITEFNNGKSLSVSVQVPASLRNTNPNVKRVYAMVRVHNGKADVINGVFNEETGKFTFPVDGLCTFALVYKDVAITDSQTAGSDTAANVDKAPDTSDRTPVNTLFVLMICSLTGMVVLRRVGRKEKM